MDDILVTVLDAGPLVITDNYAPHLDVYRELLASAIVARSRAIGTPERDEANRVVTQSAMAFIASTDTLTFDERAKFNLPKWGDGDRIAAEIEA